MRIYYEKSLGDFRIIRNTRDDFWFPAHIHKGIELIYIFSGKLDIQLNDDIYHLSDGDFIFISSGIVHSYSPNGFADFWIAVFDPNYVHSIFRKAFNNTVPKYPVISALDVPDDLCLAIEKTLMLQGSSSLPICAMWLQIILAEMLPLVCPKKISKNKKDLSLISQITAYLAKHYLEPVTLDTLARELNLNHYYVSHIFSQNFHMPLPQYLNFLRTDHAIDLMQNTDLTLTQIWINSGFQTQRTFNRAFRQVRGVSPSEYRKSLSELSPQFPDELSRESLGADSSVHR